MFNNIILKINILSFMTGIRHPQSPAVTAPVGHAAPLRSAGTCAALFPPGNLADAPVRPCRAFPS